MFRLIILALGFLAVIAALMGRGLLDDKGRLDLDLGRFDVRPAGQAVDSKGRVTLTRERDSHFYADVDVDGTTLRMLVDSGATTVALTRADAQRLGIDPDDLPVAGYARTAGGTVPVRRARIDRIAIGPLAAERVAAVIVDSDLGVSLLGQSFLRTVDTVTVQGARMTLENLPDGDAAASADR